MVDIPKNKVLFEIVESETTVLDPQDQVKTIGVEGTLKVKNPSSSHRLWNLNLHIKNADNTSLAAEATKEAIEPQKSWDFTYAVKDIKAPILELKEEIDTSKNESGVNNNFALKTTDISSIKLVLKNVTSKPINEIKLTKDIPDYFKELKIVSCSKGNNELDLDTKKISWSIDTLLPEESAELVIEGRPELTDSTEKSGNPVDVEYYSEMNLRSMIEPSMEALTDTMSGLDQEEDDSTPGQWNCEVEFDNESDIEVTLKSVQVSQKVTTGEETVYSKEPNTIVAEGSSWSDEFTVSSPAVPSLSSKLDFTVNTTTYTKIIGKIQQIAKTFNVLETTIEKTIDPPTVKANANTDMTITNTIKNVGTASIDTIALVDTLPKDFEAPTYDKITLELFDENGVSIKKLTNEQATLKIVPENPASTTEHKINVDCKGLVELFKPGCKLVMKYPLIARNPQPNVKYATPVTIVSNTAPKGPGYKDQPVQEPIVGIQYVKRKIKTMKSISPAGREGAFNVVIKINNKGGVELEKITVEETIPKGFTAGEFEPAELKPEYKELTDGAMIIWFIERLDAGKSLKLKYVSEGAGEFPRTEPKVIIEESDSIKTAKKMEEASDDGSAGKAKLDAKSAALVSNVIEDMIRDLNRIVDMNEAGEMLEEVKDQILKEAISSPILREMMQEANRLKAISGKKLIGEDLDKMIAQLKEWKDAIIG